MFITDRGTPAHVLLTIDDFHRLTGGGRSMVETLAMDGPDDIDFDPPKLTLNIREVDFD